VDTLLDIGEGRTLSDEAKVLGRFALAWQRITRRGLVQHPEIALATQ